EKPPSILTPHPSSLPCGRLPARSGQPRPVDLGTIRGRQFLQVLIGNRQRIIIRWRRGLGGRRWCGGGRRWGGRGGGAVGRRRGAGPREPQPLAPAERQREQR